MSTVSNLPVTERIVSVKKHTIGFVIGGLEYTRKQALKLTRSGAVKNARIVRNQYGEHLIGTSKNLYSLPTRLGTSRKFAAHRSK